MKNLTIFLIILLVFNTNASADITTGLTAWLKFDDGSGTNAVDSTGNGHTGTLSGSPVWSPGNQGDSLYFSNTTGQYVQVASPNGIQMGSGGDFTITAWINLSAINYTEIACKDNTLTWANHSKCLQIDNTGKVDFAMYSAGNFIGTNSLSTGQWYLVAVTYAHSSHTFTTYINGVQDSQGTGITNTSDSAGNPIYIGEQTTGYLADGYIDEVRFYSRALAATDIAQLYNYTGSNLWPGVY